MGNHSQEISLTLKLGMVPLGLKLLNITKSDIQGLDPELVLRVQLFMEVLLLALQVGQELMKQKFGTALLGLK